MKIIGNGTYFDGTDNYPDERLIIVNVDYLFLDHDDYYFVFGGASGTLNCIIDSEHGTQEEAMTVLNAIAEDDAVDLRRLGEYSLNVYVSGVVNK